MKKIRNILLIDDDTISSWLNQAMLERSGLVEQVECIYDGKSAITYLKQCCANPLELASSCPDIIFLDLDMPVVSGFDVLEQLQQFPECAWLIADRVVVLTTSIYYKDMERAKAYPIRDFLVKPLTETKIKGVLDRFLNTGDQVLPDQHQAGTTVHIADRDPFFKKPVAGATSGENKAEKV